MSPSPIATLAQEVPVNMDKEKHKRWLLDGPDMTTIIIIQK